MIIVCICIVLLLMGDLYVGIVYIVLFNLCFVCQYGGQFILCIEDIDQLCLMWEFEQQIYDVLCWFGIEWDEGLDVGGLYGLYWQSECGYIYKKYLDELVEKGYVFICFCMFECFDVVCVEQMVCKEILCYDGYCMYLLKDEVQCCFVVGEFYVICMKVLIEGVCVVLDMFCGDVEILWDCMDMQVLMKVDGLFIYFFVNVVDDYLMGIIYVLCGEEWLLLVFKLIKFYEYFGWEQLQLCYMLLLCNLDKSKLFKCKNLIFIIFYECMGYLLQVLFNYFGWMGWLMLDECEKFIFVEMIEYFDLLCVFLGGLIFDLEKFFWLNGQWICEQFVEEFVCEVQKWVLNFEYLMKIVLYVQGWVENFSQIVLLVGFFFSGGVLLDVLLFEYKKFDLIQVCQVL